MLTQITPRRGAAIRAVRLKAGARGVTLLELLIVVSIIGVIAAVSFPAVTSGLDSLRLRSASDTIVSFLNAALNRAERRQEPMEVTISRAENALVLRSIDPNFVRRLDMPEGVRIERLHPTNFYEDEPARAVLLLPGGAVPRLGIEISNRKGARRIVRVDPITGVPRVEEVER
ncbi:MAG: prepilin-type N-terminal cleavage/methylation domain-containing protein [Acidobacteria bacterium]|nr:prepilin-type N-terminal cleavage/methylation domain-containing protein [Acidobacteriota bacterium]